MSALDPYSTAPFPANPPPLYKHFRSLLMSVLRKAGREYAPMDMSADYNYWHNAREGESVAMVKGHMITTGANAESLLL